MDRLSNTKSNVSATYGRRLNKSYYEPFQGFAYCILMINIVDMKKKKEIKIAGSLTLALTGSVTCLNFSISSHLLQDLNWLCAHTVLWWSELVRWWSSLPQTRHSSSPKVTRNIEQWAEGYKKTPNKNLWWCFFQEASSCAQFRRGWKIKMRTSENPLTVLT